MGGRAGKNTYNKKKERITDYIIIMMSILQVLKIICDYVMF